MGPTTRSNKSIDILVKRKRNERQTTLCRAGRQKKKRSDGGFVFNFTCMANNNQYCLPFQNIPYALINASMLYQSIRNFLSLYRYLYSVYVCTMYTTIHIHPRMVCVDWPLNNKIL